MKIKDCLLLLGALVAGAAPSPAQTPAEPAPPGKRFVADAIYELDGKLVFERPGGAPVETDLADWMPLGGPSGGKHVGLVRTAGEGADRLIRILDRSGRVAGSATISADHYGIVTDRGVISLPKSLHGPLVSHEIGFYSLAGELLREVSDPAIAIVNRWPSIDGRLITLNKGPEEESRVILAYGHDGKVIWRRAWQISGDAGDEYPHDIALTADNQRLITLRADVSSRAADITVLGPEDRVVMRHRLPILLGQLALSPDSKQVAAAGQYGAVLLDAGTGAIAWRKDEEIDLIAHGGVRFDPDGKHLLVVSARRDREAGLAHVTLRSLQLSDGEVRRVPLRDEPLGQAPVVQEIRMAPGSGRRIVLPGGVIVVPAQAWRGS